MLRRSRFVAVSAVVALGLAGCGTDDATSSPAADPTGATEPAPAEERAVPVAHDAWVRMPATGQTVAAAYVTFVNGGDADVQLTGVRSEIATAQLHETVADDDGVMRMQERIDGFVVPAGGELVLAPGGAHVMLVDVDPLDLATAPTVELTFQFGEAGDLVVIAEVRRDSAMPGHDRPDDDGDHRDGREGGNDGDADAAGVGLDVHALHALDDELHVGVFEPERQRALVAASLAALDDPTTLADVPADVDLDRLRAALADLDAALAAGDVADAAAMAFVVHDLTHALVPHDHDHGHGR